MDKKRRRFHIDKKAKKERDIILCHARLVPHTHTHTGMYLHVRIDRDVTLHTSRQTRPSHLSLFPFFLLRSRSQWMQKSSSHSRIIERVNVMVQLQRHFKTKLQIFSSQKMCFYSVVTLRRRRPTLFFIIIIIFDDFHINI